MGCENYYLTEMPTEVLNKHGLTKTLMTRRETIYLKHVLKNVFIYGNEEKLKDKLDMLNFKSVFDYMSYTTNKIRSIYKITRDFKVTEADDIIKTTRNQFYKMLALYKNLKPVIIVDFDNTITNKNFHDTYRWLVSNYSVIINSANPMQDTIENYLYKHDLPKPKEIFANKGKRKKIVRLKYLALKYNKNTLFFIDDEEEYLEYGCLLFMYCYKYNKNGKIKNYTFFLK